MLKYYKVRIKRKMLTYEFNNRKKYANNIGALTGHFFIRSEEETLTENLPKLFLKLLDSEIEFSDAIKNIDLLEDLELHLKVIKKEDSRGLLQFMDYFLLDLHSSDDFLIKVNLTTKDYSQRFVDFYSVQIVSEEVDLFDLDNSYEQFLTAKHSFIREHVKQEKDAEDSSD